MKKKVAPKGYTHNEDREIFRNGEHVGTYHEDGGGRLTHPESVGLRFASPISNYVRLQGWVLPSPTGQKLNEIQPEPEDTTETETVNSGSTEVVDAVDPEVVEETSDAKSEEIPPCPEMSIQLGDKTHEVVDWYLEHHPEEFAKRYANRHIYLGMVDETGNITPAPEKKRKRIL